MSLNSLSHDMEFVDHSYIAAAQGLDRFFAAINAVGDRIYGEIKENVNLLNMATYPCGDSKLA
ncbi:hypothetical protein V6Z54_07740 [Bacillus sp. MAG717A]|uniref:hypothetical protein n=1 Tax=Bacillus sp. MAG717A TaxID=3122078 RepID=UPI0030D57D69